MKVDDFMKKILLVSWNISLFG